MRGSPSGRKRGSSEDAGSGQMVLILCIHAPSARKKCHRPNIASMTLCNLSFSWRHEGGGMGGGALYRGRESDMCAQYTGMLDFPILSASQARQEVLSVREARDPRDD